MNYATGTLPYAYSTAHALSGVDFSYAVLNGDCTLRTNCYAISVTKAGVSTSLIALVVKIYKTAALYTVVLKFTGGSIARACARNVSNTLNYILSLCAKHVGNLTGNLVTAYGTKIGFIGLTTGKSLSVAVTATISASATVSTGKAVTHACEFLVLFNSEEFV